MWYEWSSDLETGNSAIDNQHKQLIVAINNLIQACKNGTGQQELGNTLEFLNGYIIKHFDDEEKLMRQSQYAGYGEHRAYHESFKSVVLDLTKQLMEEGPTESLIGEVHTNIVDWLLNHMKGDDFRLASYLGGLERR